MATETPQITRFRRRCSDLCRNRASMTSARLAATGSARVATFVRSPAGSDAEITLSIIYHLHLVVMSSRGSGGIPGYTSWGMCTFRRVRQEQPGTAGIRRAAGSSR